MITFSFDHGPLSYASLPERFYARQAPLPVRRPELLVLNEALAADFGLDVAALASEAGVDVLAGNQLPEGADPVAMAYAGHQFGNFVPQLGDGRAILLGHVRAQADGALYDIQLKGSGRTPFSRGGDGRAPLGPVLREYLVSEAMNALGIPTTRALAASATGEPVMREEALPGGVLVRGSRSLVRVGSFEYFAARQDTLALAMLADHAIARLYPDLEQAPQPYQALLARVAEQQADLVARWHGVGFIHGVMNTDNCSIAGETLDYGPCAFMDAYDPATCYSYIDRYGRYAFQNQAAIAQWNLAKFAEALLPLLEDMPGRPALEAARDCVAGFADLYEARWLEVMGRKLGLERPHPEDQALIRRWLDLMQQAGADYTASFRELTDHLAGTGEAPALTATPDGRSWLAEWQGRLQHNQRSVHETAVSMAGVNPVYIPRTHLVEEALGAAHSGDLAFYRQLLKLTTAPFERQKFSRRYEQGPRPDEMVTQTFCGT